MNTFIPPAKPLIGDEEVAAVERVMRSGMLAQGPEVAAFEKEFGEHFKLGRACVAVNSGTSGLHLGLLAAGVKAGDEVIVPSFTFAATANSVALTGATPVFADIDRATFCLDPAAVEAAVTERTVGIMPVHLYGHPADMTGLQAVADKHGLALFEDAAQAHGASLHGTPVGAFGAFAMFSLYPTKNMTSGEGGMVSVATPEIERMLRLYRNQGMERQYENEVVGFNNRMTDIHAAIGRVQLTKVDAWTATRQSNAAYLSANLSRCDPAAGRRRRGARLPPVHGSGRRRPGPAGQGVARGVPDRLRHVLSDPEPPARAVQRGPRPPGDRTRCGRMPLAAGAPVALGRRPRADRHRGQRAGRRGRLRWPTSVPG